MKNLFATLILIFTFCVISFAQNIQDQSCPATEVLGPARISAPGETITFTATISNKSENIAHNLRWTALGGKIINGQGTLKVTIEPETDCSNVTATIELLGLPISCTNRSAFEKYVISDCFIEPILLEEFSISAKQINEVKLDNLTKEFEKKSDAKVYIVEIFERKTSRKTIEKKNQKTIIYLNKIGLDNSFIVLINGYAKKNLTKFILVPSGAEPSICSDCAKVELK